MKRRVSLGGVGGGGEGWLRAGRFQRLRRLQIEGGGIVLGEMQKSVRSAKGHGQEGACWGARGLKQEQAQRSDFNTPSSAGALQSLLANEEQEGACRNRNVGVVAFCTHVVHPSLLIPFLLLLQLKQSWRMLFRWLFRSIRFQGVGFRVSIRV